VLEKVKARAVIPAAAYSRSYSGRAALRDISNKNITTCVAAI